MTLRLIPFIFLLTISTSLNAQLNLKVGYEMIFFKPEGTKAIIDAFNSQSPWLDEKFDAIKYLHGFHTGLRYQAKPLAWEASYSKRFRVSKATGDDPDFGLGTTRKISYNVELISFAQEIQIGNFGLGASLDYNWVNVSTEIVDEDNTLLEIKDNSFSSQFHIVFHVPKAGFTSLSIQPYVQIYWSEFDVSALGRELNVDVGNNTNDNLSQFGVKFILYNGE